MVPVDPLLALLDSPRPVAAVAKSVGLTSRTVHRKRRTGLTFVEADAWAVACGFMPDAVWPGFEEDWDRALAVPCPECDGCFLPTGRQRYCSRRCQQRAGQRRRRQDPAYRRYQAEYAAVYRAAYRDGLSEYARAYYRRNRERLLAEQKARDARRRQTLPSTG